MKITNPLKPGWHTSEFWLSTLAVFVGVLLPIFRPETGAAHILGFIAMALTAAGYSVSRGMVKAKAIDVGAGPPDPEEKPEPTSPGRPAPQPPKTPLAAHVTSWAILFVACALACSSCCYFASGSASCRNAANECAKKTVIEQGPRILPILADLAMHGTSDLESELANLAVTLGEDGWAIIRCTMKKVAEQTQATLTAHPGAEPSDAARGHARAEQWLATHKAKP